MKQFLVIIFLSLTLSATADESSPTLVSTLEQMLEALEKRGLPASLGEGSRAAIQAVAQTLDPHSRLMTEEELEREQRRRGGFGRDIGIRLAMTNSLPVVSQVMPDTPAAEADVRAGDVLLTVQGQSVTNLPLPLVRHALAREERPAVTLRRTTEDGIVTLTQQLVSVETALPGMETAERLPRNIGYILVNGMFPGTGMDVVMRFREWTETGAIGLILDVRGAGGRDIDSARAIASLFCPGGTLICSFRDRNDQDVAVHRSPESNPITVPAIILVDETTYGLAEALAAALKDTANGVLILGHPTPGDMDLREAILLPSGDHLWIATRKLVTATGRTYDGTQGLTPDILVPASASAETFFEPTLEPGRREILDVEYVDAALRRRVRGDTALRLATDLLIGLHALEIRPGLPARENM